MGTSQVITITVSLILVILWLRKIKDKERTPLEPNVNFSVSSYLEEIEKVHLSILEEQENWKPDPITLWWGLDGVRLNDAGEVEWISRRKKPEVNYTYSEVNNAVYFHHPWLTYPDVQWNGMVRNIDYGIQQMTGDINSSIQSQIDSIQRLQFQASHMAQNAYLRDSIRLVRNLNE